MTKKYLVELLKEILNTDTDLEFLWDLESGELETLAASIRCRVEQEKQKMCSQGS